MVKLTAEFCDPIARNAGFETYFDTVLNGTPAEISKLHGIIKIDFEMYLTSISRFHVVPYCSDQYFKPVVSVISRRGSRLDAFDLKGFDKENYLRVLALQEICTNQIRQTRTGLTINWLIEQGTDKHLLIAGRLKEITA